MKYLTGQHALNLECELETFGDWHASALQWEHPTTKDSSASILGDYGIETNKKLIMLGGRHHVANHIRACLDLLIDKKYGVVQGMRSEYLCNDIYNEEIFGKVLLLKDLDNWNDIDKFMCREYTMDWLNYKNRS